MFESSWILRVSHNFDHCQIACICSKYNFCVITVDAFSNSYESQMITILWENNKWYKYDRYHPNEPIPTIPNSPTINDISMPDTNKYQHDTIDSTMELKTNEKS